MIFNLTLVLFPTQVLRFTTSNVHLGSKNQSTSRGKWGYKAYWGKVFECKNVGFYGHRRVALATVWFYFVLCIIDVCIPYSGIESYFLG